MVRTIRNIQFYAIFGLPFMMHATIEFIAHLTGWTRPLSRRCCSHVHVKKRSAIHNEEWFQNIGIIADPGFSTDDCYESGPKTSISARSAENDSPDAIK